MYRLRVITGRPIRPRRRRHHNRFLLADNSKALIAHVHTFNSNVQLNLYDI